MYHQKFGGKYEENPIIRFSNRIDCRVPGFRGLLHNNPLSLPQPISYDQSLAISVTKPKPHSGI